MFETAEEKAAKKQARDEEQARVQAAEAAAVRAATDKKARTAWLASPVGAATGAKQADQEFFEVQLQVGAHTGTASWGAATGQRVTVSSAGTLGEIERVGWRLEHASHVFMVTGQTSTDRVFLSGENTAVSGSMVGVYLFRNDRSVPVPADAGPPTPTPVS
jgi:hypothetical protein